MKQTLFPSHALKMRKLLHDDDLHRAGEGRGVSGDHIPLVDHVTLTGE